jgi:hypothetical protein
MSAGLMRALWGVELSRPKVAWTAARAVDSSSSCLDVAPAGRVEVRPLPILDDDEGAVIQREVDVPVDERVERLGRVRRRCDPGFALLEQPLADVGERRRQQVALAGEVLVDGRPGDAAGPADVVHGGTVEAALGEQRGGGVEDLLPPVGHGGSLAQSS